MINLETSSLPIGIFDSGLGGLSVMRKIKEVLPKENLVYFADTARVPYGNKSVETIIQYSIENTEFLLKQKIKLLVIACHTASVCALEKLQSIFSIPIIAITDATLVQIQHYPSYRHVALIGTERTINSCFYQTAIHTLYPAIELISISCPHFVPLIEEGLSDRDKITSVIKNTLQELLDTPLDAVILACTHFPFLIPQLKTILGNTIPLLDPAHDCALLCQKILVQQQILNPSHNQGTEQFFVSDHLDKFKLLGERFLKTPITSIQLTHEPFATQSIR